MFHKFIESLVAFGPAGLLILSFIDSVGVPVAAGMDALVILIAVKSPSQAWWCASLAVAGSTAGNYALFAAARRGGKRFLARSAEPGKAQKFRVWFQRYGLVTIFVPALLPIPMPLKLFVISAGALHTNVAHFLAVIVLARILRYFGEAGLGLTLGQSSAQFLKSHAWYFVAAAVLLFFGLYWLVRLSDRWRRTSTP